MTIKNTEPIQVRDLIEQLQRFSPTAQVVVKLDKSSEIQPDEDDEDAPATLLLNDVTGVGERVKINVHA